ncbi:MAG: hypothetical protein H7177_09505 [Rhizobacter sp.]|nr:hypothetical protein [Bacteriovorax sp.]
MFPKFLILMVCILLSFEVFSEEAIENIPREKTKILNNWEVVSGLKSVNEKKYKGSQKEIFKKQKGQVMLKRTRRKGQALLNVENEDEAQVVYNPKRRASGTIDGTLIIYFNQMVDQKEVLKNFPIKKMRQEAGLKFGIYKVKAGNDIEKVVEDLKKDPRVNNVEVEVLSSNRSIKPL